MIRCVASAPHRCAIPSSTSVCRRSARAMSEADQLHDMEPFYPLHAYVCDECLLVQLAGVRQPAGHLHGLRVLLLVLRQLARHAEPTSTRSCSRLGLSRRSQVVEIASNDGYLLQYFVARGIPALGIEPAAQRRRAPPASRGADAIVEFFGARRPSGCRRERAGADLLIGNNVLAQVPDLNDFVGGLKVAARAATASDPRVPAPAAADRGATSSTRSTTSISPTSRSSP